MYRLEFLDQNTVRFQDAVDLVGSTGRAHAAFRRAVNHTGARARTRVRRALAKQMGLTQKRLRETGALTVRRANHDALEYTITGSGRPLSLREFGARQFSYGVRAKPWGEARRFPGAFIFAGGPRSGQPVAGGHVFVRTTGASLPIRRLYGPAVPTEMVKDATAQAFEATAAGLSARVQHEMSRITDGVVD